MKQRIAINKPPAKSTTTVTSRSVYQPAFPAALQRQPDRARDWATQLRLAARFGHNLARFDVSPGGGRPLPEPLRQEMEGAYGQDFSTVQVHEGTLASRFGAKAITQGTNIHFAPDAYRPDRQQGRQLVAHELAHVVQQRLGRVPLANGKTRVDPSPALETEAQRAGTHIAQNRGLPPGLKAAYHGTPSSATPATVAPIQRATFAEEDSSGEYGKRKYKRLKGDKELLGGVGPEDLKMQTLNHFALDVHQKVPTERKKNGGSKTRNVKKDGPHIAASVHNKTLYVAINTKHHINGVGLADDREMADATKQTLDDWEKDLPRDPSLDGPLAQARRWLVEAGKKEIVAMGKPDPGTSGNIHGEMRILHHLLEKNKLKSRTDPTGNLKKVLRIGGTKPDCKDCHEAEHGKFQDAGDAGSAKIDDDPITGLNSYDMRLNDLGYLTLTPGTHGESFNKWRHPESSSVMATRGKLDSGAIGAKPKGENESLEANTTNNERIRRNLTDEKHKRMYDIIAIQSAFRQHQLRNKQKNTAAMTIQSAFRQHQLRNKQNTAATTIQSAFRKNRARETLTKLKGERDQKIAAQEQAEEQGAAATTI
ncbi:MAG: DUF4157 domain-containing protein, partial [Chloroflexota bacterium]